jgi:hypothetical protein
VLGCPFAGDVLGGDKLGEGEIVLVFECGDCRVVGVFVEDGEAVASVSVGGEGLVSYELRV